MQRTHARGGRRAWTLIAPALTVAAVGIFVWALRPGYQNAVAGMPAPSFSLPEARGGRCDLTNLLTTRRAVLLSFLDARSKPLSRIVADPSRGQLVFLKSMAQQYASKGLAVVIVGCDGLSHGHTLVPRALLNLNYDWQLDGVPVLWDDYQATALRYGVFTLPTTFLVASDGRIQRRWDGFVAPAQLALTVESLLGPPLFRR